MKESTLKMNLVKRDNEAEISLIGWLDATNAPDAQKVLEQQAERFDRIEQAVARHPMVRTAECYLTPRNEVRVVLTQRVPLLRVQLLEDGYLIDTDRRVMQARAAVNDPVLVVTGNSTVQLASGVLADFAKWLRRDAYWRMRIKRVQVMNPHLFVLHMTDPQAPQIILGDMNGYAHKLRKLRTFFDNGEEETAGKQYKVLDIRFRNQVIGK